MSSPSNSDCFEDRTLYPYESDSSDDESSSDERALDEGSLQSNDSDYKVWHKPSSSKEQRIYQILGCHPRILSALDNVSAKETPVPLLENGDLRAFLLRKKDLPLATRLAWAIEIAEGIAYLHSHNIVWANVHMGNMLLTDDYHVVLSDFTRSVLNPDLYQEFKMLSSPIFACPLYHYGIEPTHVDIFGFAVTLFALLDNRFPFTVDLSPTLMDEVHSLSKHERLELDQLQDPVLRKYFGPLLDDCFRVKISRGSSLIRALADAHSKWFRETNQEVNPTIMCAQID
ncbi:hypothetical protein VKT23_020049 [Stygiomarasmius scandens]|uniref:Protein kinase domain-containing protein n=1 Tax=Marasmiellus scandens TaxID=2682957 RepID=A0ABR1INS9_9AGAR